jgi:hypothetical protein
LIQIKFGLPIGFGDMFRGDTPAPADALPMQWRVLGRLREIDGLNGWDAEAEPRTA